MFTSRKTSSYKIFVAFTAVMLAIAVLPLKPAYAAACNATISGNWSAPGTWSCGHVPTAIDDVTINVTRTVSFDAVGTSTVLSLTVNGKLNFDNASGNSLNVGGNVTNSGTIAVVNKVNVNSHSINVGGNFTNNGIFTSLSVNDSIDVMLNGTSPQAINGTVSTTFNNLTISNAMGAFLSGVNAVVNGTLGLGNSIFTTGTNTIFVNGTVTRTSGFVNGNLNKPVAATGTINFEIGSNTIYAPASVTFTSVGTPGSLTVSTTTPDHPNLGTSNIDSTKSVNRYWTLISAGGLTGIYDVNFNFASGEIDESALPANFISQSYNGATWSLATISGYTDQH
jgi:hypothetical protein